MGKLEHIKGLLADIQNTEGENFVVNKTNLVQALDKYDKDNASLIIKVIIILGAIFGSSSLLGFIFVTDISRTPTGMIMVGVGLIVLAVFLINASKILIFETSLIAMLFYGGLILGIGLTEFKSNESLNCLYFLLAALFVLLFSKNSIQLFFAILVMNSSLISLIHLHKISYLLHVYHSLLVVGMVFVFLNEARMLTANSFMARLYNPLKSGLIISLLISLFIISTKNFITVDTNYPWLSSLAPILAILFLLQNLLKELGIQETYMKAIVFLISLLILGLTAIFPAIAVAILVILLCFKVNYKTGFAVGILSLIYFIVQFYYDLDYSLLVKSELMIVSGLLFGGFYFFSAKKLATNESN